MSPTSRARQSHGGHRVAGQAARLRFPSSEIYGGINGFFDYGPLGVELKKNIRDCWWNDMVRRRDDIVGIETSIIMHPKVWEASGHVGGFTDPMVDCKTSKQRFRADQIFFAPVVVDEATIGYVSALESASTESELQAAAETLKRKKAVQGKLEPVQPRDMTARQAGGNRPDPLPRHRRGFDGLTPPRSFNMMFQTNVGALTRRQQRSPTCDRRRPRGHVRRLQECGGHRPG